MTIVGNTSLFSLKVFGEMLGESMMNRFWYQVSQVPDTVAVDDVVQAFTAEVDANWSGSVSADWNAVRIIADEVTSQENFYDGGTGLGPGEMAGENMGPNIAMAYRLHRATKATRSGWKRIAGIVEDNQADGRVTAGQLVLNALLATDFATPLTVDTHALFPVIVRKTYTGDPPVLNDPTLWIYNIISGVSALENLTTQNTRKYGR